MDPCKRLLLANMAWVEERLKVRPDFFAKQVGGQTPEFMWIGCSDSRVPAEEVTGCGPGELFVHRNIANLVQDTDLSVLGGIEYAVDVLQVSHIVVCGHYNCGGVKNAMVRSAPGVINLWLQQVEGVYRSHEHELNSLALDQDRWDRMVEINVVQQLQNLAKTSVVRRAWRLGRRPMLHAWVYDLRNGLLRELGKISANGQADDTTGILDRPAGQVRV